jgi:thiopurine S-methyltransferase
MDINFWHQKWERGEIGFHQSQPNPLLVKHFERLNLGQGSRIWLPLCGMTIDISWLLSQGCHIVGVELSQLAIEQLFESLQIEPQITPMGHFLHYRAPAIAIFVGNLFDLSAEHLGRVDAIYDRAALVALPATTRQSYATHLTHLSNAAPQLVITYEYDQSQMAGPPFSVPQPIIEQLYNSTYQVQRVEQTTVAGKLKGQVASTESAWLLHPK